VNAAFAQVTSMYGALDVLVNSAGVAHVGNVELTSEEDFDRVYSVNVKGVYNCLRAGVLDMKGRGGAILNIASVASTVGVPDRFASMSKGAVLTMTLSRL
jgi:NAD(P)-dependent dehydrogenase (short-subunit alcohol dehydrogenase family)